VAETCLYALGPPVDLWLPSPCPMQPKRAHVPHPHVPFDSGFNNVLDAGESDIDCGGDVCTPCGDGRRCDKVTVPPHTHTPTHTPDLAPFLSSLGLVGCWLAGWLVVRAKVNRWFGRGVCLFTPLHPHHNTHPVFSAHECSCQTASSPPRCAPWRAYVPPTASFGWGGSPQAVWFSLAPRWASSATPWCVGAGTACAGSARVGLHPSPSPTPHPPPHTPKILETSTQPRPLALCELGLQVEAGLRASFADIAVGVAPYVTPADVAILAVTAGTTINGVPSVVLQFQVNVESETDAYLVKSALECVAPFLWQWRPPFD
jgi:hypothetical protein